MTLAACVHPATSPSGPAKASVDRACSLWNKSNLQTPNADILRWDAEGVQAANRAAELDKRYQSFARAAHDAQALWKWDLTGEPNTAYQPILDKGARAVAVIRGFCK